MCTSHQQSTGTPAASLCQSAGPCGASTCAMFAIAAIGIAIVDLRGAVIEVNPTFGRLLGYRPAELAGHRLKDHIHPEDRACDARQHEQLRAGGIDDYQLERRFVHRDGRPVWVSQTSSLLRDAAGQPSGLLLQLQDLTASRQTTAALQASEQRYRALIEQLPAIVYTAELDAMSGSSYVSPQIASVLGFTPDEWLADPELWLKQVHPDDRALVLTDVSAIQSDGQPREAEFRSFRRDGELVWLRDMAHVVRDEAGAPLFMQGITFDITDRKRAEASARASEERFRRAFELGLVGMALTSPDKRVLQVNDELCAMLGHTRGELEDMDWTQLTHPDDIAADIAQFERVLAGAIDGYRLDKRFVRKDGRVIHTTMAVRCVRLPDGGIDYFVALVHDLTDRVRAEEALRSSEARYRTLAHHIPRGAVFLVDHELRYQIADGQALADFGYTREGVEGRTLGEVLGAAATSQEPLYRAALQGSACVDERSFGARTYVTHYLPVPRADGTIEAALAVSFEVTDQKRTEAILQQERAQLAARVEAATNELRLANAELARAARLKDDFLASMSHELRTPLNAILGMSESLREQIYGDLSDRQERAVRMIEESGHHLLSLISDILDVAKIGAGKLTLDPESVNLRQVCEASMRLVRQTALQKRLALQTQLDPALASMVADPRRLKQILVNLLANAVKFTPDGGTVGLDVAGDQLGRVVRFTVWDTGIGIAPEQQAELFQPFVQLDSRLTREHAGTGLGLALVARLAELHGGQVTLASEPGRGSRFTVTLPWHADLP